MKAPKQICTGSAAGYSMIPTFGVFCLLTFCFVIFSHKLPLGEVAAVAALIAAAVRPGGLSVPLVAGAYLVYVAAGLVGLPFSNFKSVVAGELLQAVKFALIGLATCNILKTGRDCRSFVIGYLALYALFPVRGAFFNYLHGITEFGRIAWNFFFSNPNELAITCFLPIGLCGYLVFLEKRWIRIASIAGIVVLIVVQLLTQSRGALIGLGAAVVFFTLHQQRRVRAFAGVAILVSVAAMFAPASVWERLGGLSKVSVNDMSQVDPEGSASGRWGIMGVGAGIALAHPIVGTGLGAYPLAHAQATASRTDLRIDQRGARDAHSTFVRAAAETGFIGLVAIVICILGSMRHVSACRVAMREAGNQAASLALLALQCSMLGYFVAAFFNSAERSTFFILQYAVPWALATHMTASLASQRKEAVLREPLRRGN